MKLARVAVIASTLALCAGAPRHALIPGSHILSPFPFRAAGVYWHGDPRATVRARASTDGKSWTAWLESRGELVDGDRIGSGLLYFDGDYAQIQVEGVPDPEVLLIHPGSSNAALAPKRPLKADASAPPVVPREQWGCTPQTCPQKDPPVYTTVTHLIVHHTDGANSAADWPAVVRSIWVLHVQGNGWNDIGYNYLIDPNGVLYEGRAGGDGVLGAHFSGVNSGTMGVALLGTYIDVPPPAPMVETLQQMLAWQADKWRLDPTGEALHASSGLMLNVISGHRDAGISPKASGTTECPGNTAYTFLPEIRKNVYTRMAGCPFDVGERNRCISAAGGTLAVRMDFSVSHCGSVAGISLPDWVIPTGGSSADLLLTVAANNGPRRSGVITAAGQNIVVTQSGKDEPPLACVGQRGIVNAADYDARPVVAGSHVAIFGDNLGDSFSTNVLVNGKPVTVEYAGTSQINVLLPSTVAIGTNHLNVQVNGTKGPETNFWVTEAMPAIFADQEGHAIAVNVDEGTLNSSAAPVRAGRPLTLYLTAAGATNNDAFHTSKFAWSAAIGGRLADGLFLGLAPLFVGVYQANIGIPADLSTGDYRIAFTVNGVTSRPALVSVSR